MKVLLKFPFATNKGMRQARAYDITELAMPKIKDDMRYDAKGELCIISDEWGDVLGIVTKNIDGKFTVFKEEKEVL